MSPIQIFKLIIIVAALAIFAAVTVNFMSTSFSEYQEYYQAIMADKEYQKYLETLPLSFDGISVSVNDGVVYYATGKARPKKEDLTVIAHFSEKGKDFDKILDPSEFDLVVPDNFSVNGGSITVKYLYQPEKAEDAAEDPAPIIRSSELNISLTPVVLTSLKVLSSPYRVYYSDEMSFEKDGIKLEAGFNCGEKIILDAADIEVLTTGNLSVGTESAKISYTSGDVTLEADVPITVASAAEYDDGEIIKIKADDGAYASVAHGQSPETANPPSVRATYKSGNRLLLAPNEYSITSETETAYFYNSCILKISLNSNPAIACQMAANVSYMGEAEDATAVGGTKADISDALFSSGATVGTMTGFKDGDSLTFTINSENIVKAPLSIRIANMSDSDINLAEIITVKVNGRYLPVSLLSVINPGKLPTAEAYSFSSYTLSNVVLNKGINTIEITFRNMKDASVAIDYIALETKYKGMISSNTEEHIVNSFEAGITPDLTVEMVKEFHTITNGTYIHGMCTDGTYIYVTRAISETPRHLIVSKYDASTFELVASSPRTEARSEESNAGITYYDGKIIIFFADGTEWCIDPSLEGEWTEYTGFAFEGAESAGLRDVYYNDVTERFAVLVGSGITVYGKDMKAVSSFDVNTESGGLYITRMTGSSDYIYVAFSKDGSYQPTVQIYDWSGNYVGKFVAPNSAEVVGSFDFAKTNIQGLVILNGDFYFTQIRWVSGSGSAFLKVSYPKVDATLNYELTIGEYVAATVDGGVTSSATASPANKISATGVYAMGGAYDGEYLYISMTGLKNLTTTISKVDPVTLEVIGETVTFIPADIDGDNSRIFLKDGKLYCIIRDGSMYEISVDSLNGVGCNVTKSELSFAQYGTTFSACWNDSVGRFAVLTNDKKLHIVNEDLSSYVKDITLKNGSVAPSSVTCDDQFIYVSYKASTSVPIDVYTWDGEKVGSVSVSGFTLGTDVNFNVQAIFFVDGQMHATVCSWTNGYMVYHDWIVDINEGDLK